MALSLVSATPEIEYATQKLGLESLAKKPVDDALLSEDEKFHDPSQLYISQEDEESSGDEEPENSPEPEVEEDIPPADASPRRALRRKARKD